jgi:hypothetical protein
MSDRNTKIIVVGTYFGHWPIWFPAFLLSCAKNETIQWLFFTDCEIPQVSFPNIKFVRMNLNQLNELASRKLGLAICKDAYSQVDLQPAYGVIFEDYIQGYEFWGHCDIDVVWGDIRNFFTDDIFKNYDILSPRKDFLAGHLTLWRNDPRVNTLFNAVPSYREIFSSNEHHGFDEPIMSTFLRDLIMSGSNKVRVYWPTTMVVWFYGKNSPVGWYWKNGKVFDTRNREYIYLHFQHWNKTWWKKSVSSIDFQFNDQPEKFKFTMSGIQSRSLSAHNILCCIFIWQDLKGLISNFITGFKSLLRLVKKVLLVKSFFWAQGLVTNSISARDVQYNRKTGGLLLKRLGFCINKGQCFLLDSYYWALQLKEQQEARFYYDEQDKLIVDVGGVRLSIRSAEEILSLKRLLIDGVYNKQFSRPVVVLDIGMNAGLATIYFANNPNVVVVLGYEPCEKQYNRAMYNISLNPLLSRKIQLSKVGISDSKFKSIAMSPPEVTTQHSLFTSRIDYGMGPKFDYEEINIEDAAEILDSIIIDYPGFDIVVNINLEHPEYHIDGVSEYHLIRRLYNAEMLKLIDTIILRWRKSNSKHSPSDISRQLSESGFSVLILSPYHPGEGILYAVRRTSANLMVDRSIQNTGFEA